MLQNPIPTKNLFKLELEDVPIKTRSSYVYSLLFFILFLVITLIIPPRCNNSGYFSALRDKHLQLATRPSPRFIFIGGSNLAFGLDSNLIEKTFHMPVVNMGLCASFGLRYMVEEIKDQINSNDIIVIIPEYGILQNTVDGSTDLIHAIEVYPTSIVFIFKECLSSKECLFNTLKIILGLPTAKWNAFFAIINKMIENKNFDSGLLNNWEINARLDTRPRYYFDKHGDFFGHFNKPNKPHKPNWETIKSVSPEAADILNDFNKFAHNRGAQVLMFPPPLPSEYLTSGMCSSQNISNWPAQKISVPILAKPRRYSFSAKYFYETPYHLNFAGREKRTLLLLEDLKQFFCNG